ncbi:Cthe_2314 family HEPN domain-containing protein [Paenibacillus doosanensis]|uniref:Cthe-2314-like HEPN domain-containing protein n=1 Tax=Paenibacillus konkukensis TaxID=2020716 RepID=A0ABY4RV80_9BACL|nr:MULTISPECIES: Cthe_2314 family HEPN domain-containing protein [Paenibacillus]MCS7460233.1 Cthe_2314 family HEPN domain-containing protein [Paenibacillus doosanensis]UQZ86220.1 hypothetical protein SK3146_05513 [Paenibacillus konkukensis]
MFNGRCVNILRTLFNEPRREDTGEIKAANEAIERYVRLLRSLPAGERNLQERRYLIWSGSFLRSLDELEQSHYAAKRCGSLVSSVYVDEMDQDELDHYHRHLYFYKNTIIRMFAILDKLGQFMNERFRLKTEEIKSRFSYFTVLRNMHENRLYIELEELLYSLKERYKEPVERLRKQRNLEIHTINADLLDDLLQAAEEHQGAELRIKAEDIKQHLADLEHGCDMTYQAVRQAFSYIYDLSESSGQYPHPSSK